MHGVKDRHLMPGMFKKLPAFARSNSGDYLRAIFQRKLGVTSAEVASDALDEDFSFGRDEDRHF